MDQSYSFWADLLSKFHIAPTWIQALWLLAGTACVVTALHTIKTIVVVALRRGRDPQIELVYGVCRDRTGRLIVYSEVKDESPLLPTWRDRIS